MTCNFKPVDPIVVTGLSFYFLSDIAYRKHFPRKFNDLILVDRVTGCWNWQGSTGFHPKYRKHRYGQVRWFDSVAGKRRSTSAHRFAYMCVYGPVAEGLDVHHECENKLCVNPSHLTVISHAENVRRTYTTGVRRA